MHKFVGDRVTLESSDGLLGSHHMYERHNRGFRSLHREHSTRCSAGTLVCMQVSP